MNIEAGEQFKPEFLRVAFYGALDHRLGDRTFIAGETDTIADMACYPWIVPHERQGRGPDEFPNLKRWFQAIAARRGRARSGRMRAARS